ncbi:MAG: ATP-binding protein, partial [Ghiorsea sp.]
VARTLAGGLSHQFNNLMVGVVTTSEILLQRNNEPEENQKLLKMIHASGAKAVKISRQLLAYAQGGQYNVSSLKTPIIIDESINKLNGTLDDNISISCDLEPFLGNIEGDKSQLVQMVDGLLHNAIEAMPSGGNITISSCEHQQLHPSNDLDAGVYASITITDTGTGIEAEKIHHIFEPFYTTKFLGRGLGLAAAWGIVRNHHGNIDVESETGKGTSITILLPIKEDYNEIISQARTFKTYTHKKSILLIEDNDVVISVTSTLLRHWGHHVIIAKDATAALEQANIQADSIDMIILDLGLPGRSGGNILGELRDIIAAVPILIVSGYPVDEKTDTLLASSDTLFLRKPFSPSEINEKMHFLFGDDD